MISGRFQAPICLSILYNRLPMESEVAPFVVFGYGSLIFKAITLFPSSKTHTDLICTFSLHLMLSSKVKIKSMAFTLTYLVEVPGFLKGYVRRFAQASHDHRGTEEVPSFQLHGLESAFENLKETRKSSNSSTQGRMG